MGPFLVHKLLDPRPPPHTHRAVKQGQFTGSVGTTYHGKGSECREVRIGQTGRVTALGGETLMGTATSGGKGFKERTRVGGERPIGAASSTPDSNPRRRHANPHSPPRAKRRRYYCNALPASHALVS